MLTDRRQPGPVHAGRRAAWRERLGRARLHGRRRHLPQRDDPARRRDPAADVRPRTRPVRPGLPRLRGPQHRPVHARGVRQAGRRPPRLGDLPRPGRAAPGAARRRAQGPAGDQGAARAVSPATIVTGLLKTGGRTTMRALRKHPEGVDLGPLRPTMPERLQTRTSGSTSRPSWWSPTSTGCAQAAEAHRPDGRRAAADRPAPQAGLQLLAAQHRPADPRQAAPPPADAPRRPRRRAASPTARGCGSPRGSARWRWRSAASTT